MNSNSKTTEKTELITKNHNNDRINNKLLLCCIRPPGTPLVGMNVKDAVSVRAVRWCKEEIKEPVFTYVAAGEKQGVGFPRVVPAATATATASMADGGDGSCDKGVKDGERKKKKGGGKKLMRIFKAVLFETSLAKKIKRRKLKQKLKRSTEGKSEKSFSENSVDQESQDYEEGGILSTTCSSLGSSSAITSSSTCSSSLSLNSKSFSERNKSFRINTFERTVQKQKPLDNMQENGKGCYGLVQKQKLQENIQEHGKGCYGPDVGFCFLLISLLVLVFWGKLCAIFCTSAWLFFVPRWSVSNNSSENLAIHSPNQLDSDYKKKIIIDRLLERHSSCHR